MRKILLLLFIIISVAFSYAQTYNMSNGSVSTCSGNFYDSGGSGGNYGNNQTFVFTICPSTPGAKIRVNFTAFNIENNYDFLEVFDGNSIAAPSLGVYTGTAGPGIAQATVGNTSGCLTFRFTSDGSVTYSGWTGIISCTTPCQTITANFLSSTPAASSGIIRICPGQTVTFNGSGTFSNSGAGATYQWNFGNGNTANGTTVSHTYSVPGSYQVSLVITDPNGCTSNNNIGITVQVSTTPTINTNASPATICLGQSTTISGNVTQMPFVPNCTPPISGTTFLPDGSGVSYTTSINVNCYASGQTITNVSEIQNICLDMEHSYLGDLQIRIICPNGQSQVLKPYTGTGGGGGGLYLGCPLDDPAVGPGTGRQYCFTPGATTYLVNGPTSNCGTPSSASINAGNYMPTQPFTNLIGCPLNGNWTIEVTDNLAADNGYIFGWDVNFNVTPANGSFTPTTTSQGFLPATGLTVTGTTTNSTTATFTPTTTGTHCFTYSTTNDFGCTHTQNVCVNVTPGPSVTITPTNPTICAGQSTTLTATGGGTYLWSTGATTSSITVSPTTTTTYTVQVTNGGCTTTQSVTVNVNPLPNVTVTPSTSICTGQSVTLTANGATTYTWSPATGLSSTTGATVTATPTTTTTYTVTGTTAGCSNTASTTITITPNTTPTITPAGPFCINAASVTLTASVTGGTWSGPGVNTTTGEFNPSVAGAGTHTISYTTPPPCGGTATTTITVHPLPNVTVTPANITICQGQGINLSASGATSYSWTPATGLSSTTGATVTASPTSTTTYTVTGTSNGCSNTATSTVTVVPPNIPTITPAGPFCTDNGTVTLNASVSGGVWAGPGVNPSTGVFDPAAAGAGTHTITYTTPAPCGGTATTTIVVNAVPVVTVNPTSLTICQGQSLNITANGATSYTWSPSAGLNTTTGNSVIATPTTSTTYTVTGTTNGCSATANSVITVVPPTTPVITPAGPFCSNDAAVNLSVSVSGGTWSGNGITDANNGTFDPAVAGAGTHTITYTTPGVCGMSVTETIIVNPLPNLTVTPANPSICIGSSVNLVANGATSYSWSPATGLSATSGSSVTANPSSTTTYTVTGTTNGCSSTQNVVVTVNPLPVITINPNNPTICNGQSVTLTASGANTYSWSPSTGLSATNSATVTANPTTTINYVVIGTSAAGCTNTGTVTVNVNNNPTISVTPANPSICVGDNITLTASGATNYTWTPATGLSSTTGATVTANPNTTTAYTVTGTDANGCSATGNVTVAVNPLPTITVTPANTAICLGNNVNLTANGASNYSWSPSNGLNQTSGTTVTANPTSTTTYTVTGTDANGCSNTASATVTVNPLPNIVLGPNNPTICNGSTINLTATGAANYVWSPATGLNQTTGNTVAASPATSTQYTVVGTDANGCVNSSNITVTVNPLPIINVNPNSPSICLGNSTTLNASGAISYTWSPASGLSSTSGNTVNANPTSTTIYTVTGTDINGCVNSTSATVTVNPLPNVSANAAPSTICQGATTTLTANGADNYTWSPSASLSSSMGASVTAQPANTTTYTITGTDSNGCINTATLTVNVNPIPSISVSASPNVICVGNSSVLTATGASTYTWTPSATLSSPTGSTVTANPVVTTTYTVTGTTMGGCSSTATITVTVNPLLSLTVIGGTEICYGSSVNLTAIASGGNGGPYFYNWSPANGLNITNAATVTASPTTTTTYTVSVSDNCGTPIRTEQVTVIVHPLPEVSFTADTLSGCVPVTVNFENTSPTSFTCAWDFGNGNYSNDCNPQHTFNQVGTYPVSLTITDAFGCINTQGGMNINVYPYPVADFTMGPQPTTIAKPLISFNGESSTNDVISWTWNINNWDTLIGKQVQFAFSDTGTFPVTLYVVNQFGCEDSIVKDVVILGDFTIYIPNAFTPNGDGKNETWGPEGIGIGNKPGDYQLYIFNRWGE